MTSLAGGREHGDRHAGDLVLATVVVDVGRQVHVGVDADQRAPGCGLLVEHGGVGGEHDLAVVAVDHDGQDLLDGLVVVDARGHDHVVAGVELDAQHEVVDLAVQDGVVRPDGLDAVDGVHDLVARERGEQAGVELQRDDRVAGEAVAGDVRAEGLGQDRERTGLVVEAHDEALGVRADQQHGGGVLGGGVDHAAVGVDLGGEVDGVLLDGLAGGQELGADDHVDLLAQVVEGVEEVPAREVDRVQHGLQQRGRDGVLDRLDVAGDAVDVDHHGTLGVVADAGADDGTLVFDHAQVFEDLLARAGGQDEGSGIAGKAQTGGVQGLANHEISNGAVA